MKTFDQNFVYLLCFLTQVVNISGADVQKPKAVKPTKPLMRKPSAVKLRSAGPVAQLNPPMKPNVDQTKAIDRPTVEQIKIILMCGSECWQKTKVNIDQKHKTCWCDCLKTSKQQIPKSGVFCK